MSATEHPYVLGHSTLELERLEAQAVLVDPITERFFRSAGLRPGMRVLDVGSGAGDVAFLARRLVGDGSVMGFDRSAVALQVARRRASDLGLANVSFHEGDPTESELEKPVDAAVGRYVLQFQPDPAAMLRRIGSLVRPGGVVVFHEIDWGGLSSFPPVPTYDRLCTWGAETMRRHGTETRMGAKLHATFVASGLHEPSVRLEALVVGGGHSGAWLRSFRDLIAVLLPEMVRLGVASEHDVGLDTAVERMTEEASRTGSVFIGHGQFGAWATTPPAR
ncbi:MAG: class I SAM-dependent methyltransferase [Myxococcaceae bacterium]